jgi:MFS family permease
MAFLQSYTFVFGNPVIAFTVVLAELLVVSGIGGALSARWTRRILPIILIAVVLCSVVLFALFERASHLLLQASVVGQALGSFGLLAPIALLMGIPFPVGLRLLVCSPRFRAYGWAANGVASVVSSILAIPLTMIWGIRDLLLLAALCYGVMFGAVVLTGGSTASQRLNRRTRNPHLSKPTENQGT